LGVLFLLAMQTAMATNAAARTAPPTDAPIMIGKRFVFFDVDVTNTSRVDTCMMKNVHLSD
jgi:hypothetical protein